MASKFFKVGEPLPTLRKGLLTDLDVWQNKGFFLRAGHNMLSPVFTFLQHAKFIYNALADLKG